MADVTSNSDPEGKLCEIMRRLKVENPHFGRKEMHSAVLAEGQEWEKISFADVDKTWKKMKKQNAKNNKENIIVPDKKPKKSFSTGEKDQELRTFGSKSITSKNNASSSELTKQGKCQLSKPEEITMDEVTKAIIKDESSSANSNKSEALAKQLKMLRENSYVNYVVFTPPSESNDCAIQLSDPMGEIFYNVMWNRVVKAPFGSKSISRELWMIYQQLEFNLMPKYKKMLRKQLEEEFGVDPYDGKVQK